MADLIRIFHHAKLVRHERYGACTSIAFSYKYKERAIQLVY